MRSASRRFLWTSLAAVVVVGIGLWILRSAGPGPAPGGGDGAEAPEATTGDTGRAAGADSAGSPATPGLDLGGADLEEGVDLSAEFEPPESPQVQRWTLVRDGREVGSFRTEIAVGQEGMVELRFRLGAAGESHRGSVTTIPRLFYRYARQAVEAETGSPLPLLTVLASPALEAVIRMREGEDPAGPDRGEAETVAGIAGRRTSTTVGEVRIETVAAPDRLLPLRVRTTLPDGTVLEARPPSASR